MCLSHALCAITMQALLRRPAPSTDIVEAELAKLGVKASEIGHDSYQTALAKDSSDYFAFVG